MVQEGRCVMPRRWQVRQQRRERGVHWVGELEEFLFLERRMSCALTPAEM